MTNTTIMASEIAEQPETVATTLERLLPLRDEMRAVATGRRHLLFAGRGTSDNAAAYGRYLCETHSGRRASSAAPSVATHYRSRLDLDDTVAVSLSQSGRTAEIVETQAWARDNGAATVAITNDPDSDLARQADLALITAAGGELAVPATKTYTAQLTALAVLADALGPEPGLDEDLRRLPASIEAALSVESDVDSAARMLASAPRGQLVLGRGLTLTTAWETGLKLEETCLRPVRALSYADFQHGPKAVLDNQIASVVVAPPSGPALPGLTRLARTVGAAGSPVLGIGGDDEFARACTQCLPGPGSSRPDLPAPDLHAPDLPEALSPISLIVTAQLVVEATARELGLDPDQPRGLTKITQTDPEA